MHLRKAPQYLWVRTKTSLFPCTVSLCSQQCRISSLGGKPRCRNLVIESVWFYHTHLVFVFRKDANSRYHKACIEVERENAKGAATDRSRLQEKELSKRKYAEDFADCRKHQTHMFEELCKKREWIVAATLNVVSQVSTSWIIIKTIVER